MMVLDEELKKAQFVHQKLLKHLRLGYKQFQELGV